MGVYVQHQDKAIADLLSTHRGSRTRASLDTILNFFSWEMRENQNSPLRPMKHGQELDVPTICARKLETTPVPELNIGVKDPEL